MLAREARTARTLKHYWPEDPRWGDSNVALPTDGRYGPEYRRSVAEQVAAAKLLVGVFEEKYPETHWWEPDFVEAHPAVTLLLHSVNEHDIFTSFTTLSELVELVINASEAPAPTHQHEQTLDGYFAKLAMSRLVHGDGTELQLAKEIMTDDDVDEMDILLSGLGRAVVPHHDEEEAFARQSADPLGRGRA
ncbi:MAG TPA: hypothetical protein VHB51_03450 [Candidatus Saccharimonadales bacterium]|nr:hypothetical protein [Candidatus Saccharimonadales bacterium]